MIIQKTQSRNLSRDGVPTNYVAAYELPDKTLAAQSEDKVDIMSENGEVLFSSPGKNLEANIDGDVFWAEDGNIQKWTKDSGETTLARGYSEFIPGPDGKLFAFGYHRDRVKTVDLIGANGDVLSSRPLPERFNLTGAYISHDQKKALVAGCEDAYHGYDGPIHHKASLYSLEVAANDYLFMKTERRDRLNPSLRKDYKPFLLEDQRVGVNAQGSYSIGERTEKTGDVWNLLGYSAAPGGRPVNIAGTDTPASTLTEQLELISTGRRPDAPPSHQDGTPVYSEIKAPGERLGTSGSADQQENPALPSVPHLVNPNLGTELKKTLGLGATPPSSFPKGDVTQEDGRMVIEFKTGMVLTKIEGEQVELHLYGPTGDEKSLPSPKQFSFNEKTGIMNIDQTSFHLRDGTIKNEWLSLNNGTMEKDAASKPVYRGNGVFQIRKDDPDSHRQLALHPEIFSETIGPEEKLVAGEVFTNSEEIMSGSKAFESVVRTQTLKVAENGLDAWWKGEKQVLATSYRATLTDGQTIEGDETSAKVNGKELKNAKLIVDNASVTIRQEQFGPSLLKRPTGNLLERVADVLTMGHQYYELVEGGAEHVVNHKDLRIHTAGGIKMTEFARLGNASGAPMVRTDSAAEGIDVVEGLSTPEYLNRLLEKSVSKSFPLKGKDRLPYTGSGW